MLFAHLPPMTCESPRPSQAHPRPWRRGSVFDRGGEFRRPISTKFRQQSGATNREYLNPAAFAQVTAACPTPLSPTTCPQYGTYGNVGKNSFRAPPAFQMDAQVSRIFPIYETLTMALRLEAYNALNHPNFGNPDAKVSDGTFGQISGTNLTSARVFQGALKFTF